MRIHVGSTRSSSARSSSRQIVDRRFEVCPDLPPVSRPTAAARARSRCCRRTRAFALAAAAALAPRRAARRRVHLRQRPLLPRQAHLRAAFARAARAATTRSSAAACTSSRRTPACAVPTRWSRTRRCAAFADGDIDIRTTPRTAVRSSAAPARCAREIGPDCDVVLLGSIASPKYVDVLLGIFGERLLFPIDFVGRGDMSRGGLLLRQRARRRRARLRAGRRRRAPRRPAAEAAAARCRRQDGRMQKGLREGVRRHDEPFHDRPFASAILQSCDPAMSDRSTFRAIRARVLTVDGKEVRLTNLRKVFWPELGAHQRRSAPVLRRRRAGAAAAHARSRDGDEALSARRRRRVLLHEARAVAASRRGSRPARIDHGSGTSSTSRWSRIARRCCG